MDFGIGVILYLVGTALIALCLFAIPGPPGAQTQRPGGNGHGAH